jgi:Ku protein
MAPRANWKGYLRLSLVSCPIALYPASSLSEKVSFNRINRKTGNRLKQQNVDAETGEVVPRDDTVRGYEVAKGQYMVVEDEEIEAVQIESTRTIDIDRFVPKSEIDERYIDSPYYLAPDGAIGHEAFAVIRDTIAKLNMVAVGRVVLARREHVIALEPKGRGLVGTTLRYPYEVRDEKLYFEDLPELKLPKDMLDLAAHIVETKSGHFDPSQSFCRLYDALSQLFAECSVPCEHLTAEIPIEQLIFGIQIAKSGCKLIKFSASSSIQFNKCRASRHCQNDRENHDKRCAVLRHELSFRVRSEVAEGSSNLAPWQFSLIYSNPLPPPALLQGPVGS